MTDRITFGRQGQIRRGDIRVGWIIRRDDMGPVTWRVRFSDASGQPGLVGDFARLRDAKARAMELLCPGGPGVRIRKGE